MKLLGIWLWIYLSKHKPKYYHLGHDSYRHNDLQGFWKYLLCWTFCDIVYRNSRPKLKNSETNFKKLSQPVFVISGILLSACIHCSFMQQVSWIICLLSHPGFTTFCHPVSVAIRSEFLTLKEILPCLWDSTCQDQHWLML